MPILSLNIYFSFWIPFSSTLIWKKTFTRTTLWLSNWTVNKTGQLTKGVKENNARKAPELKCWTVRIAVIFLYTIDHLLGAGRIWASRIRLVLDSTPNVNVIFAGQPYFTLRPFRLVILPDNTTACLQTYPVQHFVSNSSRYYLFWSRELSLFF